MKFLLDTHTFIWLFEGSLNLSQTARHLIEDPENELVLSMASLWEMAIKSSLGKLELTQPYSTFVHKQVETYGFELLNITFEHLSCVATLPFYHRDPFDRLLIAQAAIESMTIIGRDTMFDQYATSRRW